MSLREESMMLVLFDKISRLALWGGESVASVGRRATGTGTVNTS